MTSKQQKLSDITSRDIGQLDQEVRDIAEKFYIDTTDEWGFEKLDNLIDSFIDYRGKTPPKSESGIHMLSAANIKNGFILPERKEKFVTEDTYDEWTTRGKPKRGDVVITTEAPVGEVGIIRSDETFLTAQRLITLRTSERIDSKYLKFCLQYERTQRQLDSYASGTTVSSFNQTDLRNTVIPVPPLSEQKKIGQILDNIEKKIEINNRTSELLEETGQALFENRFVQFEPYEDFKNSDIGKIPEKFEVYEIDELVWSGRGYSYTSDHLDKENNLEDSYPMINLKNVKDSGGFRTDGYKYYTEDSMKDRYLIEEGDLIVAITDLTQEGKLIGSPALIPTLDEEKNIISQDVAKIVPDNIPREFLYHLFNTAEFQDYAKSVATGTTVLHLSLTSIGEYEFALPPQEELTKFVNQIKDIHSEKSNIIQQNAYLEDLRSTLLPELISGEIRVNGINLEDIDVSSKV